MIRLQNKTQVNEIQKSLCNYPIVTNKWLYHQFKTKIQYTIRYMCTHRTETRKLLVIQEFNWYFFLHQNIYYGGRRQFSTMKCKYFLSAHVSAKDTKDSLTQRKKKATKNIREYVFVMYMHVYTLDMAMQCGYTSYTHM